MSRDERLNGGQGAVATGCAAYGPWLDDHVDGLLEAEREAELVAHLTTCRPCREEVTALRHLLQRVAELPADLEPRRHLWPGIASRLTAAEGLAAPRTASGFAAATARGAATTPTNPSIPWWAQLVAAGLLVALGYSAALWWPPSGRGAVSEGGSPAVAAAQNPSVGRSVAGLDAEPVALTTASSAGFMVAEVELLRAKQALLMAFLERRQDVSAETLELLHRNLNVIDQASRELLRALQQDPANPNLESRLLDNYRREVSLLRRLTSRDV